MLPDFSSHAPISSDVSMSYTTPLLDLRYTTPSYNISSTSTSSSSSVEVAATGAAAGSAYTNNHETRTPVHAEYSLLDDTDHRNAVQQRFMMKHVPRMLAMIALGACHIALMLDVRASCASMEMNAAQIHKIL